MFSNTSLKVHALQDEKTATMKGKGRSGKQVVHLHNRKTYPADPSKMLAHAVCAVFFSRRGFFLAAPQYPCQ